MALKMPLLRAAMRLREAAPSSWDEFVLAFENYAVEISTDLVIADHDKIFIAQGRAQSARDFASMFRNCRDELEHLQERGKANERRPTRIQPNR
jgi:hypothetical protein